MLTIYLVVERTYIEHIYFVLYAILFHFLHNYLRRCMTPKIAEKLSSSYQPFHNTIEITFRN